MAGAGNSRRRSRAIRALGQAAVLAVLAVGFWSIGLAIRGSSGPTGREARLWETLRRHPPPWMHGWIDLFSRNHFAVIVLTLAAISLLRRRWALAIAGVGGCLVAVYATEHYFKQRIDDYPSAHVTAAAACTMFAWCLVRKRRAAALVVFLVPLIVAWSVIADRMHRPADAFGGLLLGTLVVGVAVLAIVHGGKALSSTISRGAPDPAGEPPPLDSVEVEHAA